MYETISTIATIIPNRPEGAEPYRYLGVRSHGSPVASMTLCKCEGCTSHWATCSGCEQCMSFLSIHIAAAGDLNAVDLNHVPAADISPCPPSTLPT